MRDSSSAPSHNSPIPWSRFEDASSTPRIAQSRKKYTVSSSVDFPAPFGPKNTFDKPNGYVDVGQRSVVPNTDPVQAHDLLPFHRPCPSHPRNARANLGPSNAVLPVRSKAQFCGKPASSRHSGIVTQHLTRDQQQVHTTHTTEGVKSRSTSEQTTRPIAKCGCREYEADERRKQLDEALVCTRAELIPKPHDPQRIARAKRHHVVDRHAGPWLPCE